MGTVTTGITELSSGSSTLTNGLATLNKQSSNLVSGTKQLNNGLIKLNNSAPTLVNGINSLANGSSQLASGTSTLVNSGSRLTEGASTLATGLGTLNTKVPTLSSGISQLADGSQQITTGLTKLSSNGSKLSSGTAELANGATKISSGSSKLGSGSSKLGTALSKVLAGNETLSTKLGTAGKKVNKINPTNLTYNQVAKPVTTKHVENDTVPNNGTGMAPYMFSVALFVGCLALNLMYDTYTPRKYPKTGFSWWAAKMSVVGVFAILQALAMDAFMTLFVNLSPVNPFLTIITLIISSFAFISLVTFLNLAFGKVGAFLTMIFLVLQLGGSAGTYPIQLSNSFFQAIHPFLPITYSVDALRETLMIGNSPWPDLFVLLGIAALFSILIILFFQAYHGRMKEIDFKNIDMKEVAATRKQSSKREDTSI